VFEWVVLCSKLPTQASIIAALISRRPGLAACHTGSRQSLTKINEALRRIGAGRATARRSAFGYRTLFGLQSPRGSRAPGLIAHRHRRRVLDRLDARWLLADVDVENR